jgi:hypothetical protein
MLHQEELLILLKSAVERFVSQKAAADAWGISPAYLSDVLQRKRAPGNAILKALGYRKILMYEKE